MRFAVPAGALSRLLVVTSAGTNSVLWWRESKAGESERHE